MTEFTHWYLHVDLDAFFASVEQLDHPEYKGKPVIVGGMPNDKRSVVSTASYEARKYGVHSAMPTSQAYKLCPNGIFVHGRMQRYAELSYQIMNIFKEFSPDVDQMSIDEAFIDLTGTEKLFGPPEETAMKVKEKVKKSTGLTVSAGLATTKYLAKIASGFSKPDGFYYIHKGDEQQFMLNLPLEKVWGLGSKSQELIKSKGMKTTLSIYEKSLESLEFMFGSNMGAFLYNVVRGQDKNSFSKKTKYHSISAETTFQTDMTDIYAIETELLQLAQGVFFRLLKEKGFSKTVFVKIRYDDFSTCSVQQTTDKNIGTLDSYFEILKFLFEKKYDKTRSIRLLGVGFDNIDKEEKPYQLDLFETNEKKKQAVENAILKMEQKNPDLKVRKARTLKDVNKLKTILLLPFLLFSMNHLKAQENTITQDGAASSNPNVLYTPSQNDLEESSESLFNFKINDSNNVDFSISGHWQALFTNSILFSFGNSTGPDFSFGTPVFKQDVELNTKILLNNHWFFEGDFAEEFSRNTIAMGYLGDGFVKSVRLSNRNISISEYYSAKEFNFDLQGGNNQAPGISAHFQSQNNRLTADFFLRFDMIESHSATFYGMNQVQDLSIDSGHFLYGHSYSFPENSNQYLQNIENIYVENSNGDYQDSNGFRYKKLSVSDYKYSSITKKLYLYPSANASKNGNKIPNILITFTDSLGVNQIILNAGNYNNPDTFLGRIQKEFNKSEEHINLSEYSSKLLSIIENKNALVIQSGSGFIPFVNLNIYDLGLSAYNESFIYDESTGSQDTKYLVQEDDFFTSSYEDYFKEKHGYVSVVTSSNTDSNYPFAERYPTIYLNLPSNSPLKIINRSYTKVTEFQIGTNACSGTVQVYINNILDNGTSFNSETGVVKLSQTPSATDKIYIIWQEDSPDFKNGSVSAGLGVKYFYTPDFFTDISFTNHWPVIMNNNLSSVTDLQRGYSAISLGTTYQSESFKISDKTAFSIEKENASKGLLVCEQSDNSPKTYYLETNSGFQTKITPIISTEDEELILKEQNNKTVSNINSISDSNISGYKIPLSWNFSETNDWASIDIKLSDGSELANSTQFNLALQSSIPRIENDEYDIYLQLGVNASSDFSGEIPEETPCWKIDNFDLTKNNWQTVSINLSQKDRAKLVSNNDARLIVVAKTLSDKNLSHEGTIYIGPYEPVIQSIQTQQDENIIVNTTCISDASSGNTTVVNWTVPITTDLSEITNPLIKSTTFYKSADFSPYENITFTFGINGFNKQEYKGEKEIPNGFTLVLSNTNSEKKEQTLILEINSLENYFSDYPALHTVNIDLSEKKVFLDDEELSRENFKLEISANSISNTLDLYINTIQNNMVYKNGSFYINNLIFSNTKLYTNLQNEFFVQYTKSGDILKFGEFVVLKDFNISAKSRLNMGKLDNINPVFTNTVNSGFSLAGINIQGDINFLNKSLLNAGHSIESKELLFNIIELKEQYRINTQDTSLKKEDSLKFDFSKIHIPLVLSTFVKADYQNYQKNQKAGIETNLNIPVSSSSVLLSTAFLLNQKTNINDNNISENTYDTDNYAFGWYDISTYQFSAGESEAAQRNELFRTKIDFLFPAIGFSPSLNYELEGTYNNSKSTLFLDTTNLKLSLPLTFQNNLLTFSISRTGTGITDIIPGGDYFEDSNNFLELQKERTWVYTSIPFYELFDTKMSETVSAQYSATYQIDYKRSLTNNFSDLYIPSNFSFSVQRSIISDTKSSDLYQFKTGITNTSINNFGYFSDKQIFKWFNQEEIISNISTIVKIPVDNTENITYQFSTYLQIFFFIKQDSVLTTAFDYSIDSRKNWSNHFTAIYSRPGKDSLINALVNHFSKTPVLFNISRKESLTVELSTTDSINSQKYYFNHSINHNFLKYFTLITAIGGSFTYTQNKSSVLGLEFTLGAKAEF